MTAAQKERLRAGTRRRGATAGPALLPPPVAQAAPPPGLLAALRAYLMKQRAAARPAGAVQLGRADLAAQLAARSQAGFDAFVTGEAGEFAKSALSTVLGGGGLAAAAPLAPVLGGALLAGSLAIGAIDIFGGDVAIPTYATNPQMDATTALGRAASMAQARLIKQDLADAGYKFARKGIRPTALDFV